MAESVHSDHGKWSQPGVPHRGWRCTGFYDSGEDGEELTHTCEMCETTLIRYVHVMEHDEYPEALECGCVCAGRMEEDYEAAKGREARAGRRAKFPDSKRWKVARSGNYRISVDGLTVLEARRKDGRYSIGFVRPGTDTWWWAPAAYDTRRAARMAAFDYLEKRRQR